MKILLLNPKLENNFYEDIKLPPLGLAYIAGALRASGYRDVRIFDANFSKNQFFDIKKYVDKYSPDVIGIGASTPLIEISLDIAKLIRSISKDTKIIFGGAHASVFPKEVAKEDSVDYVVFGEGERAAVELVNAIDRGSKPNGIPGVAYKDSGDVVLNKPRPLADHLDDLPFPAYDLLPIRKYSSPQVLKSPFMSVFTSRGCPYRCIFCGAHVILGRKYRAHSPERILAETKYLVTHLRIREIMFKDSEFTLDSSRVEKLCRLLIKNKIKISWSCNSRVGSIDLPLLKLMRRAGCRLMQFGVESGDQEILNRLKKNITVPEIINTFGICRKAGMKTVANFMIGNPGENKASIAKTLTLAKNLKPDYANFGILTALPGTELFDMATQNNWFIEYQDPSIVKMGARLINATDLKTEELCEITKKAFRSFYLRPSYVFGKIFTLSAREWKVNFRGFLKVIKP